MKRITQKDKDIFQIFVLYKLALHFADNSESEEKNAWIEKARSIYADFYKLKNASIYRNIDNSFFEEDTWVKQAFQIAKWKNALIGLQKLTEELDL